METNKDLLGYGMTLDQLRAELAKLEHLPGSTPVVIKKDAEGNGFSPLSDVLECMYNAATTYSGETYPTPERLAGAMAEENSTYDEECGAPEGAVRAVQLGPIN